MVFKTIQKTDDGWSSVIFPFIWTPNKLEKCELGIHFGDHGLFIHEGFHCFASIVTSIHLIYDYGEFTIPKGASYFVNDNNEIVTDTLIFNGVVEYKRLAMLAFDILSFHKIKFSI